MSMFKQAVKKASKLRMSIAGPSGSGKTWTALTFASSLSPSGKIAVVDTEHGSASKYADRFRFDVLELSNFHPDNYVKAIRDAVSAGYEVVILDSLTHAWNGPGGILSIVGKNFSGWKDVAPIEQAFIEAMIANPIHVIATMRAKTQYEVEKNERTGKAEPKKVGMGAIQRDGMEYEFDIATMMDLQNTITVEKTRCPAIQGMTVNRPDAKFMQPVVTWLNGTANVVESTATVLPANGNGHKRYATGSDNTDAIDESDEPAHVTMSAQWGDDMPPGMEDWLAECFMFDRTNGPATPQQYGYIGKIVDDLAGADKHREIFCVLADRSNISRNNPISAKLAGALFNWLSTTRNGDKPGEKVVNEQVDAKIAGYIYWIANHLDELYDSSEQREPVEEAA